MFIIFKFSYFFKIVTVYYFIKAFKIRFSILENSFKCLHILKENIPKVNMSYFSDHKIAEKGIVILDWKREYETLKSTFIKINNTT